MDQQTLPETTSVQVWQNQHQQKKSSRWENPLTLSTQGALC